MNRADIIHFMNEGGKSKDLIKAYCLDMGKPEYLVNLFIAALVKESTCIDTSRFDYCFEIALNYYCQKYNIIFLYDKAGKFVKAF